MSDGHFLPKAIVAVNERLLGNKQQANLQVNLPEAQLASAYARALRSKTNLGSILSHIVCKIKKPRVFYLGFSILVELRRIELLTS